MSLRDLTNAFNKWNFKNKTNSSFHGVLLASFENWKTILSQEFTKFLLAYNYYSLSMLQDSFIFLIHWSYISNGPIIYYLNAMEINCGKFYLFIYFWLQYHRSSLKKNDKHQKINTYSCINCKWQNLIIPRNCISVISINGD